MPPLFMLSGVPLWTCRAVSRSRSGWGFGPSGVGFLVDFYTGCVAGVWEGVGGGNWWGAVQRVPGPRYAP
jgi:hypothetical protein